MKNSWIRFVLYTLIGIGFLVGMLLVMGVRIDRPGSSAGVSTESFPADSSALSQADVTALASTLSELESALAQNAQLAAQAHAASEALTHLAGSTPSPSASASAQTNTADTSTEQSTGTTGDVASIAGALEEQANQALTVAKLSDEEQQFLASTSLFARLAARSVNPQVACQRPESALELSRSFEGKKANSPLLVRDLDAARQWLEADAARLEGDARTAAMDRIDAIDRAIEYLLASGSADGRYPFAPLPAQEPYTPAALSLIAQSVTKNWQVGGTDSLAFACALITNAEASTIDLFPVTATN